MSKAAEKYWSRCDAHPTYGTQHIYVSQAKRLIMNAFEAGRRYERKKARAATEGVSDE